MLNILPNNDRSRLFCKVHFANKQNATIFFVFFITTIDDFKFINTYFRCKIRKKIVTLHANKKKIRKNLPQELNF